MHKRLATLITFTLSLSLLLGGVPFKSASALTNPPTPNKGKTSCAACPLRPGGAQADGIGADLSTLGRRTQVQSLLPVQVSVLDGARLNFVSTSNGSLAFAVNDLEISGLMPLFFQRVYTSDRDEDAGLGVGWSFVFDDRIKHRLHEPILGIVCFWSPTLPHWLTFFLRHIPNVAKRCPVRNPFFL